MRYLGLYYRVSTDRQDLASQKRAMEIWLESLPVRPLSIVTYEDTGISGSKSQRPQFQQMLQDAFNKQLDTIAVYRLDRFSRDASTAIQLILQLDSCGVAFVSITQPALNLGHHVPFRKTMLAAFAEIAEIERDTLIARVKAGIHAARTRGVQFGAPLKCTEARQQEALILREKGNTIREIAAEMGLSTGSIWKLLQPPLLQPPTL